MHLLYSKLEEYISDFLIENSTSGDLEDDNANEIISRFIDTFETDKSSDNVLDFLEKLVEITFFDDLLDKFFYHMILGGYIDGISEEDMKKYKEIRTKDMRKSFNIAVELIKERSVVNVKG